MLKRWSLGKLYTTSPLAMGEETALEKLDVDSARLF